MWRYPEDHTEPVIRAEAQIRSAHRERCPALPETAIVFFMSRGVEHLREHYAVRELPEPFPRFLNRCPIWEFTGLPVCFLDGGRGAPQACDTVETLAALGVKTILAAGMFGAFDPVLEPGECILPGKAFVEEGTSLHYYASIQSSAPDGALLERGKARLGLRSFPIVSTDAVYRQTFYKERLWREKGAVGVDMETSALFSVSRYLGLRSLALLMASDLHPLSPEAPKWEWRMTREMQVDLTERFLSLAKDLSGG